MGTYKGNVGHLMQHWTLCELLTIAKKNDTSGLNFIDAHAMAPWATEPQRPDRTFTGVQNTVRDNLQGDSVYEEAWHAIRTRKQGEGYPSSAAFVREVWKKDYSLLLCEINEATADEIGLWLDDVVHQDVNSRHNPELFPGDWRNRFEEGLPNPAGDGLGKNPLTLVSFDPHLYSRHPDGHANRVENGEYEDILRPQHLELALRALKDVTGRILIQLSTYSAQNNPQGAVISSVNSILIRDGFKLVGVVRVNGHMMSLVCARHVEWSADLADLPGRFNEWIQAIGRRQAG